MYVCICNAITEDDVHGCLSGGRCGTAKEVKAACGFKPGCGSCTKRLHAMVSEYRTASELADALTGGPAPLAAVPDGPAAPAAPAAADPIVPPAPVTGTETGAAPPTAA
jgi:bacterioferritin-associated ferredoxin